MFWNNFFNFCETFIMRFYYERFCSTRTLFKSVTRLSKKKIPEKQIFFYTFEQNFLFFWTKRTKLISIPGFNVPREEQESVIYKLLCNSANLKDWKRKRKRKRKRERERERKRKERRIQLNIPAHLVHPEGHLLAARQYISCLIDIAPRLFFRSRNLATRFQSLWSINVPEYEQPVASFNIIPCVNFPCAVHVKSEESFHRLEAHYAYDRQKRPAVCSPTSASRN